MYIKNCTECNNEFRSKSRKCDDCRKKQRDARVKRWREANADKIKQYHLKYYQAIPQSRRKQYRDKAESKEQRKTRKKQRQRWYYLKQRFKTKVQPTILKHVQDYYKQEVAG